MLNVRFKIYCNIRAMREQYNKTDSNAVQRHSILSFVFHVGEWVCSKNDYFIQSKMSEMCVQIPFCLIISKTPSLTGKYIEQNMHVLFLPKNCF
jgi:hypothetical protein